MASALLLAALALQAPACDAPARAAPFAPHLAEPGRVFRGTFGPDGRSFYYFRKETPDREDYRMFVTRLRNGAWSPAQRLALGGDYSDTYPSVSPDGRRLVFASYRPAPGDTATRPNAYLWYADRQGDGWGPPVFIGAASQFGSYHSGPLIGPDLAITFHRLSADFRSRAELRTRWTGGTYAMAEELGADDPAAPWRNWRAGERYVWGGDRSPRGDFVLLGVSQIDRSTRRRGPSRLWVSLRQGDGWTEPVPAGGDLGNANFVVFHPDGCSLVFVRDFSGLYRVALDAVLAPARAGGPPRPVEPERVGPGTISLPGRNETFPAIDPLDGALWFSVYDRNFDRQTIMRAPREGAGWGAPVVAPFSGQYGDRAPRFAPDGSRLYFSSARPLDGAPAGDLNLWVVARAGGAWGAPAPVTAANHPAGRDMHSSALSDGTLYFASSRPGGAGRSDIWRLPPGGPAERLGPPINDERSQPDLYVSPDGRWMILVITDGPGGLGGDDLYLSEFRDGAWTAPRPLGAPVNSAEYEYGPTVSPDGRYLYYTSHRTGDADMYRIPLSVIRPGG